MKADRHFIFPIYAAEAHFTIKQKNYPADWGPPDSSHNEDLSLKL